MHTRWLGAVGLKLLWVSMTTTEMSTAAVATTHAAPPTPPQPLLQHMLPNFNECWWDSWVLDVAICNSLGEGGGWNSLSEGGLQLTGWGDPLYLCIAVCCNSCNLSAMCRLLRPLLLE
jgi:hypothetical protein